MRYHWLFVVTVSLPLVNLTLVSLTLVSLTLVWGKVDLRDERSGLQTMLDAVSPVRVKRVLCGSLYLQIGLGLGLGLGCGSLYLQIGS